VLTALRRYGTYTRDLNEELLAPFMLSIAQTWCHTFQTNMFKTLERRTVGVIQQLLINVEEDAAPGLKDNAAKQAEHCIRMAKVTMDNTVNSVTKTLNVEQRGLSRSMAPDVQEGLRTGYDNALEEKGKGSVARQKVRTDFIFHAASEAD